MECPIVNVKLNKRSPHIVPSRVRQGASQVLQRAPAAQYPVDSCLMHLRCSWKADLRGLANFVQIDDDRPCFAIRACDGSILHAALSS
jgi:hypothetical protein